MSEADARPLRARRDAARPRGPRSASSGWRTRRAWRGRARAPARTRSAGRLRVDAHRGARGVDDEADAPLRREAADEHHQVGRGVRAGRELARKALVQHGEGEDVGRRAEAVERPPDEPARHVGDDQGQRERVERKARGEQVAGADAAAVELRREQPEEQVRRRASRRPSRAGGSPPPRDSPPTSSIHGTAHSPCTAMNDPMPKPASGAIHQKPRMGEHAASPPATACRSSAGRGFGTSGTLNQIHSATAAVIAASAMKIVRHDANRSANSSGVVAASAPIAPDTMIQPASDAWRCGGYQCAIAFSGAIRHAATPAPISARASVSPVSPSASAKPSAPVAATRSNTGSHDAARSGRAACRPGSASARTRRSRRW